MDQAYQDKIQAAIESIDEENIEENLVHLSSGVVLEVMQVPILRIQAVLNRFKYPDIPEVYDEDKGRSYKNPHNPEYIKQREEVDVERTLAVIDAIIAVGTKLIRKPDHVPDVEDDSWLEELEIIGISINSKSKKARYLAWVKYVAIVSNDDLALIASKAGMSLGVSEERVAAALQSSFQDN